MLVTKAIFRSGTSATQNVEPRLVESTTPPREAMPADITRKKTKKEKKEHASA